MGWMQVTSWMQVTTSTHGYAAVNMTLRSSAAAPQLRSAVRAAWLYFAMHNATDKLDMLQAALRFIAAPQS